MAFINRLSRLFKADLHAILDQVEDPEILLKHAVHEMHIELHRNEQNIEHLQHQSQILQQRDSDLMQALSVIQEKLEVCFLADNEQLARTLIKRKLETERLISSLRQQHESLDKNIQQQQKVLMEQRSQYESMRQKAEVFCHNKINPIQDGDLCFSAADFDITDADVEVAFLQEKHNRREGASE